jgi:hypothetical protein
MNKTKIYLCDGYWIDSKEKFQGAKISNGSWDGSEDDDIFYYTDGGDVIGNHCEFVVESALEIK